MRLNRAVGILVTATLAACGGAPSNEAVGKTAAASVFIGGGGFSPFGGTAGLCLASAVYPAVAGAGLVSVPCANAGPGWVLTESAELVGYSQVHLVDYALCIDVASGVPLLAACSPSWTQLVNLTGGSMNYIPAAGPATSVCLAVQNGSTASGTPIGLLPCDTTPAQSFWTWGIPMCIASANGGCLHNSTFGQPLAVLPTSQSPGEIFVARWTGQVTQYNPNASIGPTGKPEGAYECLTVNGISGTSSTLSVQPCQAVGTASQTWHQDILVSDATADGNGTYELVSALTGSLVVHGRRIWTTECVQDDGTLQECSGGTEQEHFGYFLEP